MFNVPITYVYMHHKSSIEFSKSIVGKGNGDREPRSYFLENQFSHVRKWLAAKPSKNQTIVLTGEHC